jgi:hypothetical protein
MRYFHPFLVSDVCSVQDEGGERMAMNVSWQELYRAALLEVELEQLRDRIDAAEKAIYQRSQEISQAGSSTKDEQAAMADALRALRVLVQCECRNDGCAGVDVVKDNVAS